VSGELRLPQRSRELDGKDLHAGDVVVHVVTSQEVGQPRMERLIDKLLVAGTGLDDHLEVLELPEKLRDLARSLAIQRFPGHKARAFIKDANRDNLPVEVDVDRVHCRTLK
jgi:hypothetical protein